MPSPCHPDRSEAQWRDLQSSRSSRSYILSIQVASLPESKCPPLVIPTGAKRSGGICSLRGVAVPIFCPSKSPLFRKVNALPLSSRPERTRISYFAMPATTTYAALLKESRTKYINATSLDRKSGVAQWSDCPYSRHPDEAKRSAWCGSLESFLGSGPDGTG